MFTGIVEAVGIVREVVPEGGNLKLTIESELSSSLRPGQSVAHDGVCLTITEVDGFMHRVDIVEESLKIRRAGSTLFFFPVDPQHAALLIPHGSIAINGVSLTVAGLDDERFYVSIIPHTLQKTNFSQLKPNRLVNVEYDLIGKYILRYATLQGIARSQ